MRNKYKIGDTFDVWWKIVSMHDDGKREKRYVLRNTANGCEVTLTRRGLEEVESGVMSVSAKFANQIRMSRGVRRPQGLVKKRMMK